MSALGGIINFGNTPPPVNLDLLMELGTGLQARGPDGGNDLGIGNLGMTYHAFHTTPESRFEHQPFLSSHGHLLTWNGRLDNRKELSQQIQDRLHENGGPVTDLDIVMAAYLVWGKDCFPRLIGDFCLAVWDAPSRVLYLVRDVVGTRTLFFQKSNCGIIWSTELEPLVNLTNTSFEIDEEYLSGFLIRDPAPGLTPYRNIQAVKPGHFVAVTQEGRIHEERFWGLNPNKEIRYKNDRDYEEHFLHEFYSGVRSRLRTHLPIFAELSGGLDSSSIVCAADRIIASGEAQTPRLESISYVYDQSPTADESKFIQHVEEYRGQTTHRLNESEFKIFAPLDDQISTVALNGLLAFADYYLGLSQKMKESGARVLLTGEGGDEMLGSSDNPAPELSDLLFQGKLKELHRKISAWSQTLKRPYFWLLWQHTIVPALPNKLKMRCMANGLSQVPDWFTPSFVKSKSLHERMLGANDIYGFRLPSGRDQSIGFISVVNHIAEGSRTQLSEVETTYPYTHRPLVEFLQAIPFEQRVRPGQTRSLMRRALRGQLPEKTLKRKSKGNPHEALCRAIAREWPRLQRMFEDSRAAERGYIDSKAFLKTLSQARHGSTTPIAALLKTIALELWLRALEVRQPRSAAKAAMNQGISIGLTDLRRVPSQGNQYDEPLRAS